MTNTSIQNSPAQASCKASAWNPEETGYVCKRCGGVSPVGIGYAVYGWRGVADLSRTSCDCGHSVKPEAEPSPLNADELAVLDDALGNLIQDRADYCANEDGNAEYIERLKTLRAKVVSLI